MTANLTDNQRFHLILADIAMAAAIRVHDHDHVPTIAGGDYRPGDLRDLWLERTADPSLRRTVTAMANAGMGPLQRMAATDLVEAARTYGLPLDGELAECVMEHFTNKRDAVLTYNR